MTKAEHLLQRARVRYSATFVDVAREDHHGTYVIRSSAGWRNGPAAGWRNSSTTIPARVRVEQDQ